MRHEKAVLFHSFIQSLTHQIFRRHPPCSKHLGYARKWDHTLYNILEGVSAIYESKVRGRWELGCGVVLCSFKLGGQHEPGWKIFEQRPGGSEGLVSVSPQSLSYFSFQIQIYILPWNPFLLEVCSGRADVHQHVSTIRLPTCASNTETGFVSLAWDLFLVKQNPMIWGFPPHSFQIPYIVLSSQISFKVLDGGPTSTVK